MKHWTWMGFVLVGITHGHFLIISSWIGFWIIICGICTGVECLLVFSWLFVWPLIILVWILNPHLWDLYWCGLPKGGFLSIWLPRPHLKIFDLNPDTHMWGLLILSRLFNSSLAPARISWADSAGLKLPAELFMTLWLYETFMLLLAAPPRALPEL